MAEAPANTIVSTDAGMPAPRKRSRGKKAGAAVLLFAAGVGAWWTLLRPRAASSADPAARAATTTVLPLESFTVNLADVEEGHFLRATLALGVAGELPSIGKGENKGMETSAVSMATIRDSILSVLTTCKSEELLTPEGKAKLKADLIAALNRDVPALGAREVYFTEFLVQR
ncbi:MAG: flagellar basal body-associated FliL family protein [Acidobacteriia bacterium]|nr:flagellar basal body-associated FliL family protein [Terriglobia bacterium]